MFVYLSLPVFHTGNNLTISELTIIWFRGYKTFFMLNSAEHEIYFA